MLNVKSKSKSLAIVTSPGPVLGGLGPGFSARMLIYILRQ